MSTHKITLSVAALVLLCAAQAKALTGEELYNYCRQEACGGYFVGAFDGIRIASAVNGSSSARRVANSAVCPPADASDEQVVDVAMQYIEAHPEQRYLQAANLSLRAWMQMWPCRRM